MVLFCVKDLTFCNSDILQILLCVKGLTFCNTDGDVIRRSVSSSHQWSQCDLDCPEEETKGNLGQHIPPQR